MWVDQTHFYLYNDCCPAVTLRDWSFGPLFYCYPLFITLKSVTSYTPKKQLKSLLSYKNELPNKG